MTSSPNPKTHTRKSDLSDVVPSTLLELLVCPIDHGRLEIRDGGLLCTTCQRAYPVVNGIPNFVIDE